MKIVNFGQVVYLDDGKAGIANQITLEMQDGRRAVITTDESTVQQLIALATGVMPQPVQRPVVPPRREDPIEPIEGEEELRRDADPMDSELANIFGGDGESDPGEVNTPDVGRVAEEALPEAPVPRGMGSGKPAPVRRTMVDRDGFALPVPSRTVEMDERGYPVVSGGPSHPLPDEDGTDDGTQI